MKAAVEPDEVTAVTLRDLDSHRAKILQLAARHGARNVRLFGSVARGDAGIGSDVDFLVEMEPGRSLFDLVGLTQDLEELLGCRVDVVTTGGLSPYLKESVLSEAVAL